RPAAASWDAQRSTGMAAAGCGNAGTGRTTGGASRMGGRHVAGTTGGPADGPGTDGPVADARPRPGGSAPRPKTSPALRAEYREGGGAGDVFSRDRWSHDKVVRSTHGLNSTGPCSWKVYVNDGITTWQSQQTDYPSVGPDSP